MFLASSCNRTFVLASIQRTPTQNLSSGPNLQQKVIPVVCTNSSLSLPERVDVAVSVDVYHHQENHAAYFERLAKENCNDGAILLLIDYKPGKLVREKQNGWGVVFFVESCSDKQMKDGEEFGPKEHWNVKVSAESVEATLKEHWTLVHRIDLEYHWNLFFKKK
jgi:hypothetical protein